MSTIKYRELRKRFESDGAEKTIRHLSEALSKKELRGEDFSIRELAEALIPGGHHWIRELDPRSGSGTVLLEGEGIDPTAFLGVTSQIIYNKILESYNREAFALSKLVETISTRLDGEKIPGTTGIADTARSIHPGMPYPNVGFSEDYVETPNTRKHGLIVPVTKEAIFFDRTHLILSRAAEVGEVLAINKEKRILDVVLGITNTFKWKGNAYNTYCTGTNDPYINAVASNPLVGWESLEKAENLFANMLDPMTKDPILVEPDAVLVMPQKRGIAHRLFHASEVSYSASGETTMSAIPNPYTRYKVVASRLAYRRLLDSGVTATNAAGYWFLGNFQKAFAYMENWPITVTQSPLGSEADFTQDIVVRFKASERGTPAVINPRYVVKCTA
ncbi:MAG: hypothetical protein FWC43_05535 [Planctomycetaceae bacterium]|nr:hypothetical protein [Planctomycetaceae bacterium]